MKDSCLDNDFYNYNTFQNREKSNSYFYSFDNSIPKKSLIRSLSTKINEQKNHKPLDKLYEIWNHLDNFNFEEVVVLWNDLDPSNSFEIKENYGLIYPTKKQFIQDIKKNLIKYELDNMPGINFNLDIKNIDKYEEKIIFKRSDLQLYAEKIGEKPKFLFQKKRNRKNNMHNQNISKEVLNKLEGMVGNIEFIYEDNSTIKIKSNENDNPKFYSWEELGFKSNNVKTWKLLLEILQYPNYGISFGQAYSYPDGTYKNRLKNKYYDSQWKICDELCKKLKEFLRVEYKFELPNSFKLYKTCNLNGPGKFRFKFKIKKSNYEKSREKPASQLVIPNTEINKITNLKIMSNNEGFYRMTEEELKVKIKNLCNKNNFDKSSDVNEIEVSLINAIKLGVDKFHWPESYVEELYFQK
jgi:hypothetical protein